MKILSGWSKRAFAVGGAVAGGAAAVAACNSITAIDGLYIDPCFGRDSCVDGSSDAAAMDAMGDTLVDSGKDSWSSAETGSDSGADTGSADSGDEMESGLDSGDAGCATGALICSGMQPQKCVAGVWADNGSSCAGTSPVCLNGGCVACSPGDVQCSGQQPQKCDSTGTWQDNGMACAGTQTCTGGACGGLCGPGQVNCNGQQPQSCDGTGHWQDNGSSCPVNQTCLSGACTGMCGPTQLNCNGQQPLSCDGTGHWQNNGNACPVNETCVSGGCTGMCGPTQLSCNGQQPLSCDGTGHWQNNGNPCSANTTCVGGMCTGMCGPGQTTCIGNVPQSCGMTGQWQPGTPCSAPNRYCVSDSCGTLPPSCAPLGAGMTNCGPSGSAGNCCATGNVTSGTYWRTYANAGGGPTGEADQATVSTFKLDEFEVTVGRFRQFVNAWNSGWAPPAGSGKHAHLNGGRGLANSGAPGTYESGWVTSDSANVVPTNANLTCGPGATWTNAAGSDENLPINCVNWWEAYAFCIWDEGFLPSETEWEYAAGGSQQLEYPWGSTAPGTQNTYAIYGCYYAPTGSQCTNNVFTPSDMAPVGTAVMGKGPFGQIDLAGNVWEWSLDWNASYVSPCVDCGFLVASTNRVWRGGAFVNAPTELVPSIRSYGPPSARSVGVGFRCARTP